jgi:hypothetical protein
MNGIEIWIDDDDEGKEVNEREREKIAERKNFLERSH